MIWDNYFSLIIIIFFFLSCRYGYDWKREEANKNLLRTHTTAISSRMLYLLAQVSMMLMLFIFIFIVQLIIQYFCIIYSKLKRNSFMLASYLISETSPFLLLTLCHNLFYSFSAALVQSIFFLTMPFMHSISMPLFILSATFIQTF